MDKEYVSLPVDTSTMGESVAIWFCVVSDGTPQLDTWEVFCTAADQWFINYAMPYSNLPAVKLFSIGHTIELYLKAALAKLSNDVDHAVKKGHRIKAIWDECKQRDPKFMPAYEIRQAVFDAPIHDAQAAQGILRPDDYAHLVSNQELYTIAKVLPDLKYLGAPLKQITGNYLFAYVHPSLYWVQFIRDIRVYLEPKNTLDLIKASLDAESVIGTPLPEQTKRYLAKLYAPNP